MPEPMLMVKAIKIVLKKKANTPCARPIRRMDPLVKLTSAVWDEVPITQEKYTKSK